MIIKEEDMMTLYKEIKDMIKLGRQNRIEVCLTQSKGARYL